MNKYCIEDSTSYALGMSLTIEALLHSSEYVSKVILSNKANRNEQLSYLLELCNMNNVQIEYDDKTIEKLSIKENCYCIGVFNKFKRNLSSDKHIVLYGFDNFGTLGTVLRSAISFDFRDIVLIGSDIDYFDPRCVRASMGSIFLTNIVKYKTIDEYIKQFNKQKLFAFVSNSNNELNNLKLKSNYSLVIPQDYYALDGIFENSYYIKHRNFDEISLSVRSSVILSYAYNQKRNR